MADILTMWLRNIVRTVVLGDLKDGVHIDGLDHIIEDINELNIKNKWCKLCTHQGER